MRWELTVKISPLKEANWKYSFPQYSHFTVISARPSCPLFPSHAEGIALENGSNILLDVPLLLLCFSIVCRKKNVDVWQEQAVIGTVVLMCFYSGSLVLCCFIVP